MQWAIICFAIIGLICVIQGLRKSNVEKTTGARHYCATCGWTTEQVQSCEFEKHHTTVVAPLCFNCTIKHEAIPVKTPRVGPYQEAYA